MRLKKLLFQVTELVNKVVKYTGELVQTILHDRICGAWVGESSDLAAVVVAMNAGYMASVYNRDILVEKLFILSKGDTLEINGYAGSTPAVVNHDPERQTLTLGHYGLFRRVPASPQPESDFLPDPPDDASGSAVPVCKLSRDLAEVEPEDVRTIMAGITPRKRRTTLLRRVAPALALLLAATVGAPTTVNAQWAVIDPTNLVQNTVTAVKGVTTAANMVKNFQETVKIYQQAKQYYDALKKVHNLVKSARKVQQTILMVGDISDIYVRGYGRMLTDPYFTPDELTAIADGYAILLNEASVVLNDLKTIVNENGLSIDDKGRLDVVDKCYDRLFEHRALTQYYTNKNIGVSWLRAKKANDTDRVLAHYRGLDNRYW